MIPIISAIVLIVAFYLLYNTSQRAEVPASKLRNWVRKRKAFAQYGGLVLLLVSFFIFINHYGVGAGFFIGFVWLMSVGGLTVLFIPIFQRKKQEAHAGKSQILNAE